MNYFENKNFDYLKKLLLSLCFIKFQACMSLSEKTD